MVVDFVVVDLFGVNGISEFSEDIEDGIKGGLGLELGFNLHHDGHNASLARVVEGVLLSQTDGVGGSQEDNSKDCEDLHR